jgi:hypothetical protein
MKKNIGWVGRGGGAPPRKHWDSLVSEIQQSHASRSWISHEFAAGADFETSRAFANALGNSVHIVITLRGFASLLGSMWQEYVKGGETTTFDRWLRHMLASPPDLSITPWFYRNHDQGLIVERWASIVGPQNVTVIIGNKRQPNLVADSFEDKLALARGTLQPPQISSFDENRSLSYDEAEIVRKINVSFKRHKIDWNDYRRLITNGVVKRLKTERRPGTYDRPIRLPEWAIDSALSLAESYAAKIESSGVHIIGDTEELRQMPDVSVAAPDLQYVSTEVADEALLALLSTALGQKLAS